jgi:tRNA-uridine 2-sulfurtransferase
MRSAQAPMAASIFPSSLAQANVELASPYEGIAPGQACVVYDGDRVLGGGWITA